MRLLRFDHLASFKHEVYAPAPRRGLLILLHVFVDYERILYLVALKGFSALDRKVKVVLTD